ncbi:DUF1488 domain-containing protein [Photobacterium ganghwense]|uniref:Transcriptional regulator n=1 Tax=Photobacterium ganghwense TaxID=320778 RepID=A0A0J1GZI6_9GAMM|nr:DUF1488 domain-containing protein [Photobacterium ganghwense]KLV04995.1 transcriptional regulator [Photobacterium ganghwense]PSU04298.1 DUF1488 domain-containing protein [Photobacterium ganghwense]
MNQNILFPDLQQWDEQQQAVMFPAQQGGSLIACWVSLQWLVQHCQQPLSTEAEIMAAFGQYRFDLEEIAEDLIEEEAFNQDGEIHID